MYEELCHGCKTKEALSSLLMHRWYATVAPVRRARAPPPPGTITCDGLDACGPQKSNLNALAAMLAPPDSLTTEGSIWESNLTSLSTEVMLGLPSPRPTYKSTYTTTGNAFNGTNTREPRQKDNGAIYGQSNNRLALRSTESVDELMSLRDPYDLSNLRLPTAKSREPQRIAPPRTKLA
jgi:hypothetical protein